MKKIAILIIVLLITFPANSGTIEGFIYRKPASPDPPGGINRYSGRTSIHSGHIANANIALVYLTSSSKLKSEKPTKRPKMEQVNQQFRPWLLPVIAGTTVDFPNSDPIFHNVFSYSKPKKFDLGRYGQGESKSVTFDEPGLVKVFCEIHKNMRAYIHVLETPYFSTTDASGYYNINEIPPGEYTLHIWQENLPPHTEKVKIGESDTLQVNLR